MKANKERHTAKALFISIIFILIYNQIVFGPQRRTQPAPKPQECPPCVCENECPAVTSVEQPGLPTNSVPVVPSTGQRKLLTEKDYRSAPSTIIESAMAIVQISHLGGRILSFKLRSYPKRLGEPELVNLVSTIDAVYPLGLLIGKLNDANVMYNLQGVSLPAFKDNVYRISGDQNISLVFAGELPDGRTILKKLEFSSSSYLFKVNVELSEPNPDGSPLWLEWTEHFDPESKSERWNQKNFVFLKPDNSIDRVRNLKGIKAAEDYAVNWIGFGNNYFTSVLIPQEKGTNAQITRSNNIFIHRVMGTDQTGSFELYVGPKDNEILIESGYDLQRCIDLGWFAFIGQPILLGIEFFYRVLGNYGLAIILLTLILKIALLPLTKTAFTSMAKMQEIQPEMKALRERIKDPTQLNQEMMALYKKKGVNPLGGCLPMLLQIPVFFGMYNALRVSISLRHAPFALWVTDLSAPERLDILGVPVPVMIILMGVSMLVSQLTTPSSMDPQQKKIMLLMPVFFTVMFIVYPFPSGLVLYWLVNNLTSIIQQTTLRSQKNIGPLQATVVGGLVIFGLGFVVTLI